MLQRERERVAVLARRLDRCHPGTAVRQLGQRLDELEARLVRATERSIGARRTRLERVCAKLVRASPQRHLARARERWRVAHDRLPRAIAARIDRAGRRVTLAQRALVSLSPLATLERGYAIVARREDGAVLTNAAAVAPGTALEIRLARGRLDATVDRAKPDDTANPPGD
jgi:exodeoxyribonuclease VII large subunit